jgi:hypothetical protein
MINGASADDLAQGPLSQRGLQVAAIASFGVSTADLPGFR